MDSRGRSAAGISGLGSGLQSRRAQGREDGRGPGRQGYCGRQAPGKPVVDVSFHHIIRGAAAVTDADVKVLQEFKSLASLDLEGTKVTDAGLRELKQLKSLRSLNLARTKVTDAGLKELNELNGL